MTPTATRCALWVAAIALSFVSACAADTADQSNPIGAGGAAAAAGGFGAQGGVGAGAIAPPIGGMGMPTAGTSAPIGGAGGLGGTGAIAGSGGITDLPDACVDCESPDAAVPDAEVPDEDNCIVMPITDELREIHGDVYTRYASARSVPVLSTEAPQEEALRRACMLLMDLGQNAEVLETMLEEDIGLVVMALSETSADFPEFAAWGVPDSRARGLGGVPRGLCAEENVMCDRSTDRWRGESICVHEFGHTMHLGVYNKMDSTFDGRVEDAYRAAKSAGKFSNTYAASNAVEYFGEGVQDWYNTNIESIPSNGVHNEINTREELEEYDPGLYEILAEVLPDEPSYKDCYYYE